MQSFKIDDLYNAEYDYTYTVKTGFRSNVTVSGHRYGVLYLVGEDHYMDLIACTFVLEKNITSKRKFADKDKLLSRQQVFDIFTYFENFDQLVAEEEIIGYEGKFPDGLKKFSSEFNASEKYRGLESDILAGTRLSRLEEVFDKASSKVKSIGSIVKNKN